MKIDPERLAAASEGEPLTPEESELLAECEESQALLEEMRALEDALSSPSDLARPTATWETIQSRIESEPVAAGPASRGPETAATERPSAPWAYRLQRAAAVVALFAAGVLVGRGSYTGGDGSTSATNTTALLADPAPLPETRGPELPAGAEAVLRSAQLEGRIEATNQVLLENPMDPVANGLVLLAMNELTDQAVRLGSSPEARAPLAELIARAREGERSSYKSLLRSVFPVDTGDASVRSERARLLSAIGERLGSGYFLGALVGASDGQAQVRGVRVISSDAVSPAYSIGLRAGHVITRVNDAPVLSPSDLSAELQRAKQTGRARIEWETEDGSQRHTLQFQ